MLDAFGLLIRVEQFVGGFQPFRSEPSANFEGIAEDAFPEFVPYLRALRIFVVASDFCGTMSPKSGERGSIAAIQPEMPYFKIQRHGRVPGTPLRWLGSHDEAHFSRKSGWVG